MHIKQGIVWLLCALMVLSTLTACTPDEPPHEHTFADGWNRDDVNHWHDATCEHVEEKSEFGAHIDADDNDICDTCGGVLDHTHTYDTVWSWDKDYHFYKSACGHNVKKDEDKHADANNDGVCDVCTYDYDHTHTYAETFTPTEGGHHHAPTCGHDVPGTDKAAHVDENNDGDCDVCGDNGGHEHTYADAWSSDEDKHWHEVTCGHSIPVSEQNAHVDTDGDSKCDTCGYMPEHFHTFETEWSSDANGHFHKANCGHDVRTDETAHNGFEEDGVCDTCTYVVFRFYQVTVTLPEDSIKLTAPDGTATPTVTVKEGTDVLFKLTMPGYIEIQTITGATVEGEPVDDGTYHTYTVKISAVAGDTEVTMTLKKNSNVEVVVKDGKFDMPIVKKWVDVVGTVTFHVPSSGRYVIYSTSHAGLSGVTFSTTYENPIEQYQNGISYAFDVEGESDITLNYRYCHMDAIPENGLVTCSYVVAKVDHLKTLDELSGNDYLMPTNANVDLTFTVPTHGLYQISSSSPVAWDDDVTSPHVFYVPEGELTQTITMHYKLESTASFPFDWLIEPVGTSQKVELGVTNITAPLKGYAGIEFTPDKDGSYYFAVSDSGMALYQWYSSEDWSSMNQIGTAYTAEEVKAGETIILYLRVDIYNDEITSPIDGVLSIDYIPVKTADGYLAQVGTSNVFSSNDYEAGEYTLTTPNGGLVSVDGGATWHTEITVTLPAYGTISYLVKGEDGATTVTVAIARVVYEHTLTIGENTVTMVPGKEYAFTLTGTLSPAFYAEYILSWTDPALTVSYGGNILSGSGPITHYSANSSTLTVTYNGTATAQVTFVLEDGYEIPEGDLVVGENALEVTDGLFGDHFLFVANESGTYTFSYAAGETNGYAMDASTAMELQFPYEIYLSKGHTFELVMGTADSTFTKPQSDTINIVISFKN